MSKKRKGFTLAEVLIVIGIVGTVSALTIPTMATKIDKVRYSSAYKKVESNLLNSLQRMKADDALVNLGSTEEFVRQFMKHSKVINVCSVGDLSKCFPKKFKYLDKDVDSSAITNSIALGKSWSNATNVMGITLLDGTNAIVAYNPDCDDTQDLYFCAAWVFDMNDIERTNKFKGNGLSDIGTLNAQYPDSGESDLESLVNDLVDLLGSCNVNVSASSIVDGSFTSSAGFESSVAQNASCLAPKQQQIEELIANISANSGSSPSGGGNNDGTCLAAGTMITLANGTAKPIEEIDYNDRLLVWNFDEGKLDIAKPAWIKKAESTNKYNLLTFSDGTQLKTINQHRIFNKEAGKYTYPMTDETPLGTTTFLSNGKEVQLVSKEVVYEPVDFYNIITEYHFNCFANSISTSNRFSNMYHIVNYKYEKDNRAIIPYDKYSKIVSPDWYEKFRLSEMPEQLASEDYLINLKSLMLSKTQRELLSV